MMGQTHMLGGAAGWLAVSTVTHQPLGAAALGALVAAGAALGPDIDHAHSRVTWLVAPITVPLSWLVRHGPGGTHRHLTHSVVGTGLWLWLCLAVGGWLGWPGWVVGALVAGWVSHLALDGCTTQGIWLAWPSLRRTWLLPEPLRVRTGLGKIRRKGWRAVLGRKGHTAEWWVVRPLMAASCVAALGLMVVHGG